MYSTILTSDLDLYVNRGCVECLLHFKISNIEDVTFDDTIYKNDLQENSTLLLKTLYGVNTGFLKFEKWKGQCIEKMQVFV